MLFGVIAEDLLERGLGDVRGLDFFEGFSDLSIGLAFISGVLGNSWEFGRLDLNLYVIIFFINSSCSMLSELFSDIIFI